MEDQPPPLGFQAFPPVGNYDTTDQAAASSTQRMVFNNNNINTSNQNNNNNGSSFLTAPAAALGRRSTNAESASGFPGGLSPSTQMLNAARNKSVFGGANFSSHSSNPFFNGGGGGSGGGGSLLSPDASRRSGAPPPLNRRSTMMMGASGRPRQVGGGGGSDTYGSVVGAGALSSDGGDDEDDDENGAEKRMRRALEAGAFTHAEASAAAFDQYNKQSLQKPTGAGIGGTNVTASGVYGSPKPKSKLEEAVRDLNEENEVHSEGSDSSSDSEEEINFFVQEADDDGDNSDEEEGRGVGGMGAAGDGGSTYDDDEEFDESEMTPEELEEYLKNIEKRRKETVAVFKQTQQLLRYRDFNSLNLRYKLAGMIDPAILGETEVAPDWLTYGRAYAVFISTFALLHVVAALLETVKDAEDIGKYAFIITTAISGIDFLFRVVTIAPRTSILGLAYDLIVLVGSALHIAAIYPEYSIYFALFRSLRAFRAVLLFEAYETCRDMFLVQRAIMSSVGPLMIVGAIFIIGLMLFSTATWVSEQSGFDREAELRLQLCTSAQPCSNRYSPFQSIPNAMWLVVSAMSTVGLGDVIPNSTISRVFVAISMIFGVFMIAFPAMILVANLQEVRKQYFAVVERRSTRLQVLAVMYLTKKEQIQALREQKEALLASNGIKCVESEDEEDEDEEKDTVDGRDIVVIAPNSSVSSRNPLLKTSEGPPLLSSPSGIPAPPPYIPQRDLSITSNAFANTATHSYPLGSATPTRGLNPFAKPSESTSTSAQNAAAQHPRGVVGFADSAILENSGEEPSSHNNHNNNNSSNNTTQTNRNAFAHQSSRNRAGSPPQNRGGSRGSDDDGASLKRSQSVLTAAPAPSSGGGGGGGALRTHSSSSALLTNKNSFIVPGSSSVAVGGGTGGHVARTKSNNALKRTGSNLTGSVHRVPSSLQRVPSNLRRAPSTLQQAVMDTLKSESSSGVFGDDGSGGTNSEVKNMAVLTISNVLQQQGQHGGASVGALGGFASLNSFYGRNGSGFGGGALGAGGAAVGGLAGSRSHGGSFIGSITNALDMAAAQQNGGTFEDPLQPEPLDAGTGIMFCGEALLVESQREGLHALQRICVPGGGSGLKPGLAIMPFLPTKASGSAALGNPGVTLNEQMLLYYSPICKLLTDHSAATTRTANNEQIPLVSHVVVLNDDTAIFQLTLIVDDNFARTIATDTMTQALDEVDEGRSSTGSHGGGGGPNLAFGDVLARSLPMKGLEVTVVSGLPPNMLLLRRSDEAEVTGNQLPLVFFVRHVSKYGIPDASSVANESFSPKKQKKQKKNIYKKEYHEGGSVRASLSRSDFSATGADMSATTFASSQSIPVDPTMIASNIAKELSQLQLRLLFRHSEKAACSWRETAHVNRTLLSNADIIRELRAIAVNVSPSLYWPKELQKLVAKTVRKRRQNIAFVKAQHVPMFIERMLSKLVDEQIEDHKRQIAAAEEAERGSIFGRAASISNNNNRSRAQTPAQYNDVRHDESTIVITNRSEIQQAIMNLFVYHCREVFKSEIPKVIWSAIFAEPLVDDSDVLLEVNIDLLRHGAWPLGKISVEFAFSAPVCERLSLVNAKSAPGVVGASVPINPKVNNREALQRVMNFVNEDNFEASIRHATGEDTNDLYDLIYEQNKKYSKQVIQQLGLTNAMVLVPTSQANAGATSGVFHPEGAGDKPAESAAAVSQLNPDLFASSSQGIDFSSLQEPSMAFLFNNDGANGTEMEEPEKVARRRRQEYHRKLMMSVNAAATGKLGVPSHLVDGGGVGYDRDFPLMSDTNEDDMAKKSRTGAQRRKASQAAPMVGGRHVTVVNDYSNGYTRKRKEDEEVIGDIPQDPKKRGNITWYDSTMLSSQNSNTAATAAGSTRNTAAGLLHHDGSSASFAAQGSASLPFGHGNPEALWQLQHSLGFHNHALHQNEGFISSNRDGTTAAMSPSSAAITPSARAIAISISPSGAALVQESPLDGASSFMPKDGQPISPSLMSPLTVVMDDNGNITNLNELREQKEALEQQKRDEEELAKSTTSGKKQPAKRLVSYGTGTTPAAIAAAKLKKEKEEAEYFERIMNKGKRAQEAFLERKRILEETQARQEAERAIAARHAKKNAKTKSGVTEWAESFKRFFNSNVFTTTPHSLQIKDDPSSPRRKR